MDRLYYLSHSLFRLGVPYIPRVIMLLIRLIYGSYIPYQTRIGKDVHFGHKMGIVISPNAQIGCRVKIRQQVTIGSGFAVIGDDVEFGAGAKVIGNVTIGKGAVIGANAVVVDDIPPYAVAVGVPAGVVRTREVAMERNGSKKRR